MASERIIALRQRHDALYEQLESVHRETDDVSADLDGGAVRRAGESLRRECDLLRDKLKDMLGGRSHRAIESTETLADANGILNHIVMKKRAILREVMKLNRERP